MSYVVVAVVVAVEFFCKSPYRKKRIGKDDTTLETRKYLAIEMTKCQKAMTRITSVRRVYARVLFVYSPFASSSSSYVRNPAQRYRITARNTDSTYQHTRARDCQSVYVVQRPPYWDTNVVISADARTFLTAYGPVSLYDKSGYEQRNSVWPTVVCYWIRKGETNRKKPTLPIYDTKKQRTKSSRD